MGYRSNVHIAVAFDNADTLREVMAVYAMNPLVQECNTAIDWEIKNDTILYFSAEDSKWYEGYEDVQAYEHMLSVAEMFHKERGIEVAYYFVRIGEDIDDIEIKQQDDGDGSLIEMLWDNIQIIRRVDINF